MSRVLGHHYPHSLRHLGSDSRPIEGGKGPRSRREFLRKDSDCKTISLSAAGRARKRAERRRSVEDNRPILSSSYAMGGGQGPVARINSILPSCRKQKRGRMRPLSPARQPEGEMRPYIALARRKKKKGNHLRKKKQEKKKEKKKGKKGGERGTYHRIISLADVLPRYREKKGG